MEDVCLEICKELDLMYIGHASYFSNKNKLTISLSTEYSLMPPERMSSIINKSKLAQYSQRRAVFIKVRDYTYKRWQIELFPLVPRSDLKAWEDEVRMQLEIP